MRELFEIKNYLSSRLYLAFQFLDNPSEWKTNINTYENTQIQTWYLYIRYIIHQIVVVVLVWVVVVVVN